MIPARLSTTKPLIALFQSKIQLDSADINTLKLNLADMVRWNSPIGDAGFLKTYNSRQ